MFGSSHLYVFHHPQDLAMNHKAGKKEEKVTYDIAQEEIATNSGFDMKKGPDKSKGVCNKSMRFHLIREPDT